MNSYFEKKIVLCGAGTLGGNLAENLARTGFKKITVIDKDRVEEKNLSNQPYFSHDIGQPKVKALAKNLFQAAQSEVSGVNQEFTVGNGEKWIKNADLVLDTFDNHLSRESVKSICERLQVPCLHAGISPDGYGEVFWNEAYQVPPDIEGDPCEQKLSRNLTLLVVAVASEAVFSFFKSGEKKNHTITIKDFAVCAA